MDSLFTPDRPEQHVTNSQCCDSSNDGANINHDGSKDGSACDQSFLEGLEKATRQAEHDLQSPFGSPLSHDGFTLSGEHLSPSRLNQSTLEQAPPSYEESQKGIPHDIVDAFVNGIECDLDVVQNNSKEDPLKVPINYQLLDNKSDIFVPSGSCKRISDGNKKYTIHHTSNSALNLVKEDKSVNSVATLLNNGVNAATNAQIPLDIALSLPSSSDKIAPPNVTLSKNHVQPLQFYPVACSTNNNKPLNLISNAAKLSKTAADHKTVLEHLHNMTVSATTTPPQLPKGVKPGVAHITNGNAVSAQSVTTNKESESCSHSPPPLILPGLAGRNSSLSPPKLKPTLQMTKQSKPSEQCPLPSPSTSPLVCPASNGCSPPPLFVPSTCREASSPDSVDLSPTISIEMPPNLDVQNEPKPSESTKRIIQALTEKIRRNQRQKEVSNSESTGQMEMNEIKDIITQSLDQSGIRPQEDMLEQTDCKRENVTPPLKLEIPSSEPTTPHANTQNVKDASSAPVTPSSAPSGIIPFLQPKPMIWSPHLVQTAWQMQPLPAHTGPVRFRPSLSGPPGPPPPMAPGGPFRFFANPPTQFEQHPGQPFARPPTINLPVQGMDKEKSTVPLSPLPAHNQPPQSQLAPVTSTLLHIQPVPYGDLKSPDSGFNENCISPSDSTVRYTLFFKPLCVILKNV